MVAKRLFGDGAYAQRTNGRATLWRNTGERSVTRLAVGATWLEVFVAARRAELGSP